MMAALLSPSQSSSLARPLAGGKPRHHRTSKTGGRVVRFQRTAVVVRASSSEDDVVAVAAAATVRDGELSRRGLLSSGASFPPLLPNARPSAYTGDVFFFFTLRTQKQQFQAPYLSSHATTTTARTYDTCAKRYPCERYSRRRVVYP